MKRKQLAKYAVAAGIIGFLTGYAVATQTAPDVVCFEDYVVQASRCVNLR